MFCKFCGQKLNDGARFCKYCGTSLITDNSNVGAGYQRPDGLQPPPGGRFVTKNIVQCSDKVYRWIYEVPMLENPTILFTVWKVLGISLGVLFGVLMFVDLTNGGGIDMILFSLKMLGIMILIFAVLSVVAYLIYAAINGFKYVVVFEMDEKQIIHIQSPRQFKKMDRIMEAGFWLGFLTDNLVLMGNSMLAQGNNSVTSIWKNVKSVKSVRNRNVIYVNEMFLKNQVYVEQEDFDFVENFIRLHCVNAKIQ